MNFTYLYGKNNTYYKVGDPEHNLTEIYSEFQLLISWFDIKYLSFAD